MTLYVKMALPDSQRYPEAEFIEFKPRIKFEMPLKYGLFRLKLYSMFQDLNRFLVDLRRDSNSLNSDSGGANINISI